MAEPLSKQNIRDMAWLHASLIFALSMSKDPSRKVGAVVVAPGNRLCSFGYNGLVAGMDETEENWSKPRKYDLVRHAEKNAMYCAPFDLRGCTLYCTLKPCHECMGDAVNSGVTRVVWLQDPIPFVHQKDDIFIEFTKLLTGAGFYERTAITEAIIEAYNVNNT